MNLSMLQKNLESGDVIRRAYSEVQDEYKDILIRVGYTILSFVDTVFDKYDHYIEPGSLISPFTTVSYKKDGSVMVSIYTRVKDIPDATKGLENAMTLCLLDILGQMFKNPELEIKAIGKTGYTTKDVLNYLDNNLVDIKNKFKRDKKYLKVERLSLIKRFVDNLLMPFMSDYVVTTKELRDVYGKTVVNIRIAKRYIENVPKRYIRNVDISYIEKLIANAINEKFNRITVKTIVKIKEMP